MILSVSRRTDIPNYYSQWFFNRINDGFFYARNPFNPNQINKINISPEVTDCIVFWSKNPEPMLCRLGELNNYNFYFQFTVTPYGKDIEPNLPDKRKIINTFKRLSDLIGRHRIVWRYDPILLTKKYNIDFHINAFEHLASELYGYTDKAVISFLDIYKKTEKNIYEMNVGAPNTDDIFYLAYNFSGLTEKYNISVETCAEKICLERFKIKHGGCIDKKLIERITGFKIDAGRDKNQRNGCGCIESIDMGMYNTCKSGCKYCYANQSESAVCKSALYYNEHSPLLCGIVQSYDTVTNRNVYSLRDEKCAQIQTSLF